MFKKHFWLNVLAVLIVFLIIGTLVIFLQPAAPKNPNQTPVGTKPSTDVFDKIILKLPGPKPNSYWELHVTQVENADNVGKLVTINGSYFANGKRFYQLTANNGKIYWQSGVLVVNGLVHLQSDDGKDLTTSELTWDPNRQEIVAQYNVILKTGSSKLTTEKMTATLQLEKLKFTGVTKVIYQR